MYLSSWVSGGLLHSKESRYLLFSFLSACLLLYLETIENGSAASSSQKTMKLLLRCFSTSSSESGYQLPCYKVSLGNSAMCLAMMFLVVKK